MEEKQCSHPPTLPVKDLLHPFSPWLVGGSVDGARVVSFGLTRWGCLWFVGLFRRRWIGFEWEWIRVEKEDPKGVRGNWREILPDNRPWKWTKRCREQPCHVLKRTSTHVRIRVVREKKGMARGRSSTRKGEVEKDNDGNDKVEQEKSRKEASPGRSPSPTPRRIKTKTKRNLPFVHESRTILVSVVFSLCVVLVGMLLGKMNSREVVPGGGDVERYLFEKVQTLETKLVELGEQMKGMATKQSMEEMRKELDKSKERMELHEAKVKRVIDSWKGRPMLTKEQMQNEINRISADKTGRIDYALYAGGGRVVRHSSLTPQVPTGGLLSYMPWPLNRLFMGRVHPSANSWVLMPSGGINGLSEVPGNCLPLNGSSGFIDIRLREAIIPDAITVEHIPVEIAYNPDSAPKDFLVYGWQGHAEPDAGGLVSLGSFTYDLHGHPVQTFSFEPATQTVDHIRFLLQSNHGHSMYTCVYRIRIHGVK